ncbi:hypothetical protein TNCV_2276571 [Trichonephila clavipes]|nr:hypothetical protein TNCV_2276571 [Trichonephila clavipes]
MLGSVRFDSGEVMAYVVLFIDWSIDRHIIRIGVLTDRQYKDEIHCSPYAAAIGDNAMWLEDNCKPHLANLVNSFLFKEEIT